MVNCHHSENLNPCDAGLSISQQSIKKRCALDAAPAAWKKSASQFCDPFFESVLIRTKAPALFAVYTVFSACPVNQLMQTSGVKIRGISEAETLRQTDLLIKEVPELAATYQGEINRLWNESERKSGNLN